MIKFDREYFNIKDTLECGQIFRFKDFENGYVVITKNHACKMFYEGDQVILESDDDNYFENFFDLNCDYSKIFEKVISYDIPFLTKAANMGKGIRILNQDKVEMIFSFLTSQNNNIPRIKRTIEGLSSKYGEKFEAIGNEFFAFPSIETLSKLSISDFTSEGLGYRAKYFQEVSKSLTDVNFYNKLISTSDNNELEEMLLSLNGVGPKVCDCIMLFGFGKKNHFPVDTWIEKLYHENFNGTLNDRRKITTYFTDKFQDLSGYVQQYLFYYKRTLLKNEIK